MATAATGTVAVFAEKTTGAVRSCISLIARLLIWAPRHRRQDLTIPTPEERSMMEGDDEDYGNDRYCEHCGAPLDNVEYSDVAGLLAISLVAAFMGAMLMALIWWLVG